jgi:hypothetical protein
MTQRIQRHPYLAIFDGPDPAASTPYRVNSTTPLQALYLLNDAFVHEQSAGLAQRLLSERDRPEDRVQLAWLLVLNRQPDDDEVKSALAYLSDLRQKLETAGIPDQQREPHGWQSLVRAMFRLNEFVYLD